MEYDELETCLFCEGQLIPLGALGNRLHLKCRNCGMEHNRTVEADNENL